MLMFDAKENDPNRFRNRGGNLLAEEKAKKKEVTQLPKVCLCYHFYQSSLLSEYTLWIRCCITGHKVTRLVATLVLLIVFS